MKKIFYLLFVVIFVIIILSSCNNNSLNNTGFSSQNNKSSQDEIVVTPSVFDYMKEKNISELLLTDKECTSKEMLQTFIEATQEYYYGDVFLDHIDTKSIFAYNVCTIDYNEESNIYGPTGTIFNCLIARESELAMDIRFNAIKVTDQKNKYQVFDKDNPNEEEAVYVIVSGNQVTQIITPTGKYRKIIESLDDYINAKNLTGEYRDQNNKTYRFTDDKQAIWPDQSFRYVILDFDYPECNDF